MQIDDLSVYTSDPKIGNFFSEHFLGQITTNLVPTVAVLNGALAAVSSQVIFVGDFAFLVLNEILEEEKVLERLLSAPSEPLKIFFPETNSTRTYPPSSFLRFPACEAALQIEDNG